MVGGCGQSFAPGQWWNFCGETDMGQSLPALCQGCNGSYILKVDWPYDYPVPASIADYAGEIYETPRLPLTRAVRTKVTEDDEIPIEDLGNG